MENLNLYILMLIFALTYGESTSKNTTNLRGWEEGVFDELELYEKKYLEYYDIRFLMEEYVAKYSRIMKMEIIGISPENHSIRMIKLSDNFKNCKKITFVAAGTEAYDWLGVSLVLHTIHQIVNEPRLLLNSDWHIIPVANPEDYIKTFTPLRSEKNFERRIAEGRRNSGQSNGLDNPVSQLIVSEVTKVKSRVETFIEVHSYDSKITYPYASKKELPLDWVELHRCALDAQLAVTLEGGPKFEIGSMFNVSHQLERGVPDEIKEKLEVPFCYTVQLPGGEWGQRLTIPARNNILKETFPIMRSLSQCSSRFLKKY